MPLSLDMMPFNYGLFYSANVCTYERFYFGDVANRLRGQAMIALKLCIAINQCLFRYLVDRPAESVAFGRSIVYSFCICSPSTLSGNHLKRDPSRGFKNFNNDILVNSFSQLKINKPILGRSRKSRNLANALRFIFSVQAGKG